MKNLPFFAAFILLMSCKDKLELNAPYKEVPVIYAVLDPYEKIHMIRINKAFLGEGDANEMAKVADSVNYHADELTVTLTHANGKTYYFHDSLITTERGAFSTTQRVYVNAEPLQTSGNFLLTVRNNRTGNVFTSTAQSIDRVGETGLKPFVAPYYPVNKATYNPYTDGNAFVDYSIQATVRYAVNSAKVYNLVMRFHFYDTTELEPVTRYSYVDYTFQNQFLKDKTSISGIDVLAVSLKPSEVNYALSVGLSRMNLNPNAYGRRFFKIQYLVYASTQDYIDYLEYSKPSLNINTQKPVYSNFDRKAAYGIFTFRSVYSAEKELFYPYVNVLAEGLCKYGFIRADNKRPGCN